MVVDKSIHPVDKPVDKMWITLWTNLWISACQARLWISAHLIHSLSTAYAQFSPTFIHRLNSLSIGIN